MGVVSILGMTMFFICCGTIFSADPIDSLIDQEKKAREAWSDNAEELPSAYFWGDKNGAEIYSPAAHEGKGNLICEPLEFDELIELSRGNPADQETVLNAAIPRVQEILQKSCLIRPKDSLFAVGEGWQKRVQTQNFIVKKDRPLCPQDSPYSLWVSFVEPLEEAPLFLATDNQLKEGQNHYAALVPAKLFDFDNETRKNLRGVVSDLRDYDTSSVTISTPSFSKLFVLRRKVSSPEDDGLPNEMLVWQRGPSMGKLWLERVSVEKGSGHLQIKGTLNFNRDELADLVMTGDHNRCPYTMIFQGTKDGYEPLDLPIKPCVCW